MASALRGVALNLPAPAPLLHQPAPQRLAVCAVRLPAAGTLPRPLRSAELLVLVPAVRHGRKNLVACYGDASAADASAEAAAAATATQDGTDAPSDDVIDGGIPKVEETVTAAMASLQAYKEALLNNDEAKVGEIEAFLLSIEGEKNSLASKVGTLTAEAAVERDRILRISADFDNFRKRTEKEKLSLMTNVQGEVIEKLLPVLDNFERAKAQIKLETEGEEKINNSYQSIYKQFVELLTSLRVEVVPTVGTPFDPMFHEAIMREESTQYEEGIIIEEFRKGFKLGEQLLRPAMVKVSAGPGPEKTEIDEPLVIEDSMLDREMQTEKSPEEDGDDAVDSE